MGEGSNANHPPVADIPLVVVDCNRAAEPNVAVQGLELEAALPVAGFP